MHEDKIKVVLTRPALERLISGDEELEIQMRHAAVEQIFKKHIAPLIATRSVQDVIANITALFKEEMKKYESKSDWWVTPQLTSTLKKSIEAEAEKVVLNLVKDAVAKFVTEERMEQIVKRVADMYTQEHIKGKIKTHLDRLF